MSDVYGATDTGIDSVIPKSPGRFDLNPPLLGKNAAKPPFDPDAEFQKFREAKEKEATASKNALEAYNQNLGDINQRLQKMQTPNPPQVPQLQQPPQQKYQDPFTNIGPMILFASLAGAFTRQPLTAVINASAEYAKGFHQGDEQRMQLARQNWKDATDMAIKQSELEIRGYNAAIEKNRNDLAKMMAEMRVSATMAGNSTMAAKIDAGQMEDVFKIYEGLVKSRNETVRINALVDTTMGSGMTTQALQAAAERYLQTGTLPPMGWGKSGMAARSAIQNMAADMAEKRGIDMASLPKQWQKFSAARTAITRFESGPQGNIARSLNVAIDHLSTIDRLAKALGNGDIVQFNRLAQEIAEQTGQPAPTNLDAAKQIVGPEIIKAIGVSGAGTKEERELASQAWNRARSPEQFAGATQTIKALLAGQLRGLRLQFTASTGLPEDDFNQMLLPETIKQIGGLDKGRETGAIGAAGDDGWGDLKVH